MTDAEVKAALSDRHAVAITLLCEAGGEPVEGRIAVGCVIRNRVRHTRRWSREWKRVCHQRWQFSCWEQAGGEANYHRAMAWARYAIHEQAGTPSDVEWPLMRECLWIADGLMRDALLDSTGGADHYYAPGAMVPRGTSPQWARGQTSTKTIGRHSFFRLA